MARRPERARPAWLDRRRAPDARDPRLIIADILLDAALARVQARAASTTDPTPTRHPDTDGAPRDAEAGPPAGRCRCLRAGRDQKKIGRYAARAGVRLDEQRALVDETSVAAQVVDLVTFEIVANTARLGFCDRVLA